MTIINKKIGSRIKAIRIKAHKTQEDISYEAKIDYSFYNQIENGKRNVSVKTLSKIAKVFGVDVKSFFE